MGTQKQSYKNGKLREDRVKLLEDIDFDFSVKPRDRNSLKKSFKKKGDKPFLDPEEFDKLYGQLEEYKEEHGNIDVPQRGGR